MDDSFGNLWKSIFGVKSKGPGSFRPKGENDAAQGKLTGKLDGLTSDERQIVQELLALGKDIEIIPRSSGPNIKTPDFFVDGIKTELKTLNGTSLRR